MDELGFVDKFFIVFGFICLIGVLVGFTEIMGVTGYLIFPYMCFGLITSVFAVVIRRNCISLRKTIIKDVLLLVVTFTAIFWVWYFNLLTGIWFGFNFSDYDEKFLQQTAGFERVSVPFKDGKLTGWLYRQSNEQEAPLFIFFTGAGECSAKAMSVFYHDGNLMDYMPNYDFMIIDYPSYGTSDGLSYDGAVKSMALNTYKKALTLKGIDKSRITVGGYSVGTGPASYLAMKRDLESLILISPYDKLFRQGNADKSDLHQIIFGYNVNPYDYAKHIKEPTLLIASDKDTTFEYKSVKRVADRLKNKTLIKLTGVKHQNMLCTQSYQYINKFLYE